MTLSISAMKTILIHKKAEKELNSLDIFTRVKATELFLLISKGGVLSMPVSRPMPVIAQGVHELRFKSSSTQVRVFYFVKQKDAILIFHCFRKKTQKTPKSEIELAKSRLGEML